MYPEGLVRSIVQGLLRQLKKPVAYACGVTMGPVSQENDIDFKLFDETTDADWDTFVERGKPLKTALVEAARAEELDFAKRYGVWDLVPILRSVGTELEQHTRWIDINKGDEKSPAYRSPLVIQEVRHSGTEAIFAATPPLESIRFLLSLQRSGNKGWKVMFIDIRRAHWTAKILRLVYVRLPSDVCGADFCGRLNKAMYGWRDAAQCCEAETTDFFTSVGFAPGIGSPVSFVNLVRDLRVTIHGDDITALGSEAGLQWLKTQLETRYELKFGGVLGGDSGDVIHAMVLNRLTHFDVDNQETTYEADPKHVQILVKELGLTDAKTVTCPGVNKKDETAALDPAMSSRYRSLVMRANHLALDRPDISFSAKELARRMGTPTQDDWANLKRLVRYLKGRPRLVWVYKQQDEPDELHVF